MRQILFGLVLLALLAPNAFAGTMLGIAGDRTRHEQLTGVRHEIGQVIIGWNKGLKPGGPKLEKVVALGGRTPMIHIGTGSGWPDPGEAITPREIAVGKGDRFLRALNRAVARHGGLVYIRPMAEMNAHWNFYSAFNENGTRRDAAHSAKWYRKAFARIYLITHGGSAEKINRKLAKLRLPGINGNLPDTGARVIWNPQGYGAPDVPGNSPHAYWPGGRTSTWSATTSTTSGGRRNGLPQKPCTSGTSGSRSRSPSGVCGA